MPGVTPEGGMTALPRQHCQDGKTALPRPYDDGAADTALPQDGAKRQT